jgi:hypothetical protein
MTELVTLPLLGVHDMTTAQHYNDIVNNLNFLVTQRMVVSTLPISTPLTTTSTSWQAIESTVISHWEPCRVMLVGQCRIQSNNVALTFFVNGANITGDTDGIGRPNGPTGAITGLAVRFYDITVAGDYDFAFMWRSTNGLTATILGNGLTQFSVRREGDV